MDPLVPSRVSVGRTQHEKFCPRYWTRSGWTDHAPLNTIEVKVARAETGTRCSGAMSTHCSNHCCWDAAHSPCQQRHPPGVARRFHSPGSQCWFLQAAGTRLNVFETCAIGCRQVRAALGRRTRTPRRAGCTGRREPWCRI